MKDFKIVSSRMSDIPYVESVCEFWEVYHLPHDETSVKVVPDFEHENHPLRLSITKNLEHSQSWMYVSLGTILLQDDLPQETSRD